MASCAAVTSDSSSTLVKDLASLSIGTQQKDNKPQDSVQNVAENTLASLNLSVATSMASGTLPLSETAPVKMTQVQANGNPSSQQVHAVMHAQLAHIQIQNSAQTTLVRDLVPQHIESAIQQSFAHILGREEGEKQTKFLSQYSAEELVCQVVLWREMGISSPYIFSRVEEELLSRKGQNEKSFIHDLSAKRIVDVLEAYSTLKLGTPKLYEALEREIIQGIKADGTLKLWDLSASQMTQVMVIFDTINCLSSNLMSIFEKEILRKKDGKGNDVPQKLCQFQLGEIALLFPIYSGLVLEGKYASLELLLAWPHVILSGNTPQLKISNFSGLESITMVITLARLKCKDKRFEKYGTALLNDTNFANGLSIESLPDEFVCLVFEALATLDFPHPKLLDALEIDILTATKIQNYDVPAIARILTALVTLKAGSAKLFNAFKQELFRKVHGMDKIVYIPCPVDSDEYPYVLRSHTNNVQRIVHAFKEKGISLDEFRTESFIKKLVEWMSSSNETLVKAERKELPIH